MQLSYSGKQAKPRSEVWRYAHMGLDQACSMLRHNNLDILLQMMLMSDGGTGSEVFWAS